MKLQLAIVLSMLFSGCTIVPIVDQWKNLENREWKKNSGVNIPIEISDTNYYYNINVNLRVTNDYKFSNLYLKLNISDPAGDKTSTPIMLNLADHTGKWVGHNLGHIVSFRLPAQKNVVFSQAGKYNFELEQFMRDTILKEVVSVGIRLDRQHAILK